MLTKDQKSQYREELFRHLDGIVTAPIAYELHESEITDYILDQGTVTLDDLSNKFEANNGYLNVALRVLASQGWLNYSTAEQVVVSTNKNSEVAFNHFYLYKDVVELSQFSAKFHPRVFQIEPFRRLEKIFQKYLNRYDLSDSDQEIENTIQYQILKHIEGFLVSPTVVNLGMGGMFHKYFMETSFSPDEYHKHPDCFRSILNFLSELGWFTEKNGNYTFSNKGLFFAKRASAYGVTVSYIPMFRKVKELLFGDGSVLWKGNKVGTESHVDREMNVWGSGGAHSAYFKKIDEVVKSIFNAPLEEQPKGIVDMGCGNGAFLIHLFDVIEKQTLRGEHLEEYPLFLVGVDYNQAALKVTRANLISSDVWAKVLWGDISDPDKLALDLKDNFSLELKDLLSVRTFLDHNRIWSDPIASINQPSKSSGAFSYRGHYLDGDTVERNLKDHFAAWVPYISKFGLIVIELHTISPEVTASNIGRTAATAYDATHGLSDQYIVELDSFLKIIEEVGLSSDKKYFSKFPNSELATVSIHHLVGK